MNANLRHKTRNKMKYQINARQVSLLKQEQEDEHNAARVGCHPSPSSPVITTEFVPLATLFIK